jgi:DNA invertase Pin-like site-specific DNA recombinase
MVPCVLYMAKSNEDVHGSLLTQLDDCRRGVADAGDRVIVAELFDEAVSAFKRSRGPGLAEALREAEALAGEHGESELWVQHSDRLARGDGRTARHLVEIALWALKANVAVRSIEDPDTFRDLLYAVVTGERNHEDSRRKGTASAAGVKRAVYRGEYAGKPLDGYRVAVSANERGHVTKRFEIDPERASLFRMIFKAAKRGAMPTQIARRANKEGWTTAPWRVDQRPGPITPRFVQWVLDHPRYAGLAVYKGEIIGTGQWPGYISPREHEHLRARVRQYKSPRLPREPFLLAHLASCGLCGSYMITLTGKPRADGTRRRAYVCHGHRTQRCDLPPLDAVAVDHVLVASLNRFLGGLEETEPYRPSPGFPRELIGTRARHGSRSSRSQPSRRSCVCGSASHCGWKNTSWPSRWSKSSSITGSGCGPPSPPGPSPNARASSLVRSHGSCCSTSTRGQPTILTAVSQRDHKTRHV